MKEKGWIRTIPYNIVISNMKLNVGSGILRMSTFWSRQVIMVDIDYKGQMVTCFPWGILGGFWKNHSYSPQDVCLRTRGRYLMKILIRFKKGTWDIINKCILTWRWFQITDWVIKRILFFDYKTLLKCLWKLLYDFIFPPAMNESFCCFTSLPAFGDISVLAILTGM